MVGTLSSVFHKHTKTPVFDIFTVNYVLVMKQICTVLILKEKFFHNVSLLILTNIKSNKKYSSTE
jgi:hypothetical protein